MIRFRPRQWSIRGRLTVLYGGLFFAAGTTLLGLNYLLVWQSLNTRMLPRPDITGGRFGDFRAPGAPPTILLDDGREISLDDAIESMRAAQQSLREDVLDSLLVQGGIALVGVGLVAGLLGWLLARRALQPVHRITETAQRIARTEARGLHERISLTGPRDEVTELASTFNTMLERLDRSFEGQHRFATNASHEMRTPLAVKRALIEVSTSRPGTSEDAKRLGDALLEVNARHERLIDGLLTLVDSENELTERTRVDLAEVARVVLRQLTDAADEAGLEIRDGHLAPRRCSATRSCSNGWCRTWWRTRSGTTSRVAGCRPRPSAPTTSARWWSATPAGSSSPTRRSCCSSRFAGWTANAPRVTGDSASACPSSGRSARRTAARSVRRHGRTADWT